jgi:hypothetical protein
LKKKYFCGKFKDMRTISIQMSDVEYSAYGLPKSNFYFSEIVDLVERQVARQALRRSVEMAEENNLSAMTMEEINAEVKAVRQCKR